MKKALLIIDLQNDFISGTLKIKGADSIIQPIIQLAKKYDFIIASKDYHPLKHKSFATFGGSWPVHCVKDTWGSEFPKIIKDSVNFDLIVTKGTNENIESYSAFSDENGQKTILEKFLQDNGIKEIDIVGLALDYCVYYTALDLAKNGFKIKILESYCCAVKENIKLKKERLESHSIIIEK